jgi:hypothetical protein
VSSLVRWPVPAPTILRPPAARLVSGAPEVPLTVSGLRLWLAARKETGYADGNGVATPVNWSGLGSTLTQATGSAQPTWRTAVLDSQPVFRFASASAQRWSTQTGNLITVTNAASGLTAFVVAKVASFASVSQQFVNFDNNVGGSGRFKFGHRFVTAEPDRWFASGRRLDADTQVNVSVSSTEVAVDTNWHLHTAVPNWSAGTIDFYREQTADGTGITWTTSGTTSATNSVNVSVGAKDSGTEALNGDIAEILVYDRVLTAGERQAVWDYLAGIYPSLAGGGDATVTPATVATTAALSRPLIDVIVPPATVPAMAVVPAATPNIAAGPATLAVVAAPVRPLVNVAASPAAPVAAVAALARPLVNVAAQPATAPLVVALPQATPTAAGDVTAQPAVLAAVVAVGQAVAQASSAVTPVTLAAVATLPRPLASIGAGPVTLATAAALAQPLVNVVASPAVIARAVVLPQATAGVVTTVTPATVAAVAALAQPLVNVRAGPAVLAAVVAVGQATASQAATAAPATLAAVAALTRPLVNVAAGPVTVVVVVGVPLIGRAGGGVIAGDGHLVIGVTTSGLVIGTTTSGLVIGQPQGTVRIG